MHLRHPVAARIRAATSGLTVAVMATRTRPETAGSVSANTKTRRLEPARAVAESDRHDEPGCSVSLFQALQQRSTMAS